MHLELQSGQLGFDHSLQVRASVTGVPHELHSGDTVKAGDRIRVQVQTSADAYLYLAFCSKQGITLYPSQSGIFARAGVLTSLPDGGDLVVDDVPGTEILYVVASATDLPTADSRLAAALATKRPSNTAQDCGPAFEASLNGPASTTQAAAMPVPVSAPSPGSASKVIRGQAIAKRPLPSKVEPRSPSTVSPATSTPPPDPDFVRNPGNIVWYFSDDTSARANTPSLEVTRQVTAADRTGIAVVRHVFTHISTGLTR